MHRITAIALALAAALTCVRATAAGAEPAGASEITALTDNGASTASVLRQTTPQLTVIEQFGAAPITFEGVAWVPRGRAYPPPTISPPPPTISAPPNPSPAPASSKGPGAQTQVHGGFFETERYGITGVEAGIRGGPMLNSHVQLGLGLDYEYRGSEQGQPATTTNAPSGVVINTQRQISSWDENSVPILGYLQFTLWNGKLLSPYVGAGGGYEWTALSVTEYQTGASYNATYAGWTWQGWGGVRLPLAGQTRLLAEAYYHDSNPSRLVTDPLTGDTYRETLKRRAAGMRFGLSFGF